MTISSSVLSLPRLTGAGQLWIGHGSGNPTGSTLTAGTGITIANADGSITINAVGGGTSTIEVTGITATMVANTNYIANNAAIVNLTMPTTMALGDIIRVHGKGAGGWNIVCNGGQTIKVGSASTTSGGFVTSSGQYDIVEITCLTANTLFSLNGLQTLGLTVG